MWCSPKPIKGACIGGLFGGYSDHQAHIMKNRLENRGIKIQKYRGIFFGRFQVRGLHNALSTTMGRSVYVVLCFQTCFDDRISKHPHPLREKAPLFGEVEMGVECEAQTTIDTTSFCTFGPNESKEE